MSPVENHGLEGEPGVGGRVEGPLHTWEPPSPAPVVVTFLQPGPRRSSDLPLQGSVPPQGRQGVHVSGHVAGTGHRAMEVLRAAEAC